MSLDPSSAASAPTVPMSVKSPVTNRRKKRKSKERLVPGTVREKEPEEEKPEPEKGTGTYVFPNGNKYEGEWQKFEGVIKRHGVGTFTEGDNVYSGEWKEDTIQGKGKFIYTDGASYQGDWTNGKYAGFGKYTFADGSYYEGEFVENKMHGDGCFVDTQNEVWRGKFYNNNGPGLMVWYD